MGDETGQGRSDYRTPQSAEELTAQNVEAVARIEKAEEDKRTATDRAVDAITEFCGTMTFV